MNEIETLRKLLGESEAKLIIGRHLPKIEAAAKDAVRALRLALYMVEAFYDVDNYPDNKKEEGEI